MSGKQIFFIIGWLFFFLFFAIFPSLILFDKPDTLLMVILIINLIFSILFLYFMPLYFLESIQEQMDLDKNSTVYNKLHKTRYLTPIVFIYWHIQLNKYKKEINAKEKNKEIEVN
ncbi:hypothetical protein SCHIN_v1c04710 [Spiroplasma chinense]|uniref:Uncharacterized protein n=1 Tax=Spiroplasma chinense TaxID=216932 RepID=A0A5B9Y3F2_9MOLU|nr:hypothetical protein [Spiroplasma chinense]QEH61668.1 hypothetical protein SCHIN_v1c04710 [Spiroplasma chinense]